MANAKTLYQIHDPAREDGKQLVITQEAMDRGGLQLYYDRSDAELIQEDIHPDISVRKVVLALH